MDCLRKYFAGSPLVAKQNGPVKNVYLQCVFFFAFSTYLSKKKKLTLTSVESHTSAC